ncbi:hypothetical protein AAFA46_01165 [Oscillospiraceae bacterium WX1]
MTENSLWSKLTKYALLAKLCLKDDDSIGNNDTERRFVMDCANLPNCGFIKKNMGTRNLAIQGYMSKYCQSDMQNQCKRKEYKMKTGTPPPDNMLPNGLMMEPK